MKSILLEMSCQNVDLIKQVTTDDADFHTVMTEIKLRDRWISEIHTHAGVNNEHRHVLN